MVNKIIVCKCIIICAFFALGLSLYADPAVRYAESMGWVHKSAGDVISAGGIRTGETGEFAVYEFHNAHGKYSLVLTGNRVVGVLFENDNRQNQTAGKILYSSEAEFNNDVERIAVFSQSMGGYQHHDRTANDINNVHYRIHFEDTLEINMNIYAYLANKSENNYGHYSVMITPANDNAVFAIFMPPPRGEPPPGAPPPGTPPPGAR